MIYHMVLHYGRSSVLSGVGVGDSSLAHMGLVAPKPKGSLCIVFNYRRMGIMVFCLGFPHQDLEPGHCKNLV